MSPDSIVLLIIGYFSILLSISFLTGKSSNNTVFFKANNTSPWYLVAFGMIGASLSGVTFISVPGWVATQQMSYFQMVLGYIVGYLVIGVVLLPLYYKLNLTSIYTYLESRFGKNTYKTGAIYFLLSRTVGAAFRLFLVANVLQLVVFDSYGVPFWATVIVTVLLIWLYTFKGGIKTIVWTDTLQTLFMLIAVGVCIYSISKKLHIENVFAFVTESNYSKIFYFKNFSEGNYFWKQFLSGAFIAIVMTGLDQDMMQKNLTCKTLKDAQKNMFWFTIVLVIVNFFFLVLGILLTTFAQQEGILVTGDPVFPTLATNGNLGTATALFFILGLIAAAYSSADSALTALTTSFSVDILEIDKKPTNYPKEKARKIVHITFSIVLIICILLFKYLIKDTSIIASIFKAAGYTYGPLLGLYTFGLFTNKQSNDNYIPIICIGSPILTYFISYYSLKYLNFDFGFFVLILNGFLTFFGILFLSKTKSFKNDKSSFIISP